MNRRIKKEVDKINKIIRTKYRPEKIILFGSIAKSNFNKGRDLDFLIVKSSKKPHYQRIIDIFYLLRGIKREYPVDFIVYTPKEFKERVKLGDFFINSILEEGKVLYEK